MASQGAATNSKLLGLKPSKAYEEAKTSPVYRLSELMFGSLLASYVLGFIGFFATHGPELIKHFTIEELATTLSYLFISFSFAYLTAGFYLSYNAGILTMPTMPLENLRFDFLLALSQAIAFGFSMLFPTSLLFCLGLTWLFALVRQHTEYKRLAAKFQTEYGNRIQDERRADVLAAEKKARREFARTLDNLLKGYSKLSGWRDTRGTMWWGAVGLALAGVAFGFAIWRLQSQQKLLGLLPFFAPMITLIVAITTSWRVHKILEDRAVFLYKKAEEETIEMDAQYEALLGALEEGRKLLLKR